MNSAEALRSLAGGALIGAGAATLLLLNGRIAGVSGILANVVRAMSGEQAWRVAFLLGLIAPALILGTGAPQLPHSSAWAAVSGLLVGIGTQIGGGCTSGHGVCGLANLSTPFADRNAHLHDYGGTDGAHGASRNGRMKFLSALVAGLLFGAGLLISGMTDPANVLGFLDVFGEWRPQLAFVMGGAASVAAPAFWFVRRQRHSLRGEQVELPDRRRIDTALLAGSALFGVGWGMSGICPGPGVVLLAGGHMVAFVFIGAVIAGIWLVSFTRSRP